MKFDIGFCVKLRPPPGANLLIDFHGGGQYLGSVFRALYCHLEYREKTV
jgi:hypothetical protein